MSPSLPRRAVRSAAAVLAAAAIASACAGPPVADTPQPATGVFTQMATNGIATENLTSGDSGCNDPAQAPFAIHAKVRYPASASGTSDVYLFTYADRGAWQREADAFESCRAAYASGAANGRTVDELAISPYRAFGAGWSPQLRAAIRQSLTQAAGNGG